MTADALDLPAVPRRAVPDPLTVPDLLRDRAAQQPGRDAFLTDDGRSLSYGAWDARADALAAGLRARGVRRGDRVGLLWRDDDWPDFAVGYCAVQRAGGVAAPMSTRLPERQAAHILSHCAAVGLIHGMDEPPQTPGWTGWALTASQLDTLSVTGPSADVPPRGAASGDAGDPLARPDDLAQILYTSGSTGTAKGVGATHRNLLATYDPRARQRPLAHSRHFLHAFPIGHNIGQTMLMNALTAAPTALTMGTFAAERCCALIERHQVGTVFLAPTMAADLVTSGAHRRHDLSSVALLGSTGAALPPALATALAEIFTHATVVNYYTSTEAAPTQTTMVFDPERPTSVGRPAHPDDVLVGAPGRAPLAPGEHGDIWLRSASAPRWYYGDAQASATVFRDGWTRMGDIGYLDADGYLHLVDRETDMIKSGGFKVSTLQVEAVLHEHPAVAEAAVLGVNHPSLGSTAAAAVVLRSPTGVEDIRTFARARLAPQEQPTRIVVLDELPRNEAGKVAKRALATLFSEPDTPDQLASAAGVSAAEPAREAPRGRWGRSATEVTLAGLWGEVFGGRDFASDADFFSAGGDSLKAARLAARISAAFGLEASPTFAFDLPALGAQAQAINAQLGALAEEPATPRAEDPAGHRSKGQRMGTEAHDAVGAVGTDITPLSAHRTP